MTALSGGNDEGAVRIGDTVRRRTGPWTPAVHALLEHLHDRDFERAPRPLGLDGQGREVLTFVPGHTVGSRRPWPPWVHSDDALSQVARWVRDFHHAVGDFTPPRDAIWRDGGRWHPGLVIAHNDAAPYNAAWQAGRLTGFFDWDLAGPTTREADLAFTSFGWVPLHARRVVEAEGFTAFADRPRRLRLFLDAYGWDGGSVDFADLIRERVLEVAQTVGRLAAEGDPAYQRMHASGVDANLLVAVDELTDIEF